jgi:hypothetical protein
MEKKQIKGILKNKKMVEEKGKEAKWDEENLKTNEIIQKELNPTKINEPKTPYVRNKKY